MHISAGAVICRQVNDKTNILVLYRQKTSTYHLPKGTQEPDEKLEETVIREIKEETGCDINLGDELISVESTYERNGRIIDKRTYYFVAEYIGGDLACNDNEHDDVFFAPIDEVKILLEKSGGHWLGYEDEFKVINDFEKKWNIQADIE